MKRKGTGWEKIFANDAADKELISKIFPVISDKGLVSRIDEEHL